MQNPVRKNMSAFGIGPQLPLIDRYKSKVLLNRHGFHGAAIPPRLRRFDPLFSGDQGDLMRTFGCNDAIIDLPRQQPQGKAHHTTGISAHSFDGQMGLAGICGAQNSRQRNAIFGQISDAGRTCHQFFQGN